MADHAFDLMIRDDDRQIHFQCCCGWVSEGNPNLAAADQALQAHCASITQTA
jgi:hypothetical protein